MPLTDQVALVTGGSKGIGRGISLELARAGATVAVVARGKKHIGSVVSKIQQLGGTGIGITADVTKDQHVKAAVQAILKQWGRLDILVNGVGTYPVRPLTKMTHQEWEDVLLTNLTSAFLCTRAAMGSMLKAKRGLIVFIGSSHVTKPIARPDREAYYATKGGLVGLARGLSASVEDRGVRTVVIHPGWTVEADQWNDPEKQLTSEDVGRTVAQIAAQPAHVHLRELILTPRE